MLVWIFLEEKKRLEELHQKLVKTDESKDTKEGEKETEGDKQEDKSGIDNREENKDPDDAKKTVIVLGNKDAKDKTEEGKEENAESEFPEGTAKSPSESGIGTGAGTGMIVASTHNALSPTAEMSICIIDQLITLGQAFCIYRCTLYTLYTPVLSRPICTVQISKLVHYTVCLFHLSQHPTILQLAEISTMPGDTHTQK